MSVRTDYVTVAVNDGTQMNVFVARPDHAHASPGVIVFQEAFGVNAHIRDIAQRFASLGCVAVAPELFHRSAPGFEGRYDDFAAVRPHLDALTRAGLEADVDAAFDWISNDDSVDPHEISAIGFCMGGRVAFLANARVPLRAAVSFYGGGIAPDLLSLASSQHGPLLMFWGGLDKHISPDQYRAVADALTEAGATHEQVVFSHADHGFFCDQRASYNPIAARQAWVLVRQFLTDYGALT